MILLKELKLVNFLSHENTTINFGENQKILLDGKSGSGKSSITEAILWVFYGKGRSDNRSLVRKGTKVASVSLKISVSDERKEYVVTRSVSSTGKNTLTVTQNTGTRGQFIVIERTGLKDTQDWIEKELLKASYELFINSIAYPQESENSFVRSTATTRKTLLLEIVRAGNFDDLYEKTRKAISVNELDNAVAISNINTLEQKKQEAEEVAKKYDFYKKNYDETSEIIDSMVVTEKFLESQIIEISKNTHNILDKKNTQKLLRDSIISFDYSLSQDQKLIHEHEQINIEGAKKNVAEGENLLSATENIEKELKDSAQAQMRINNHLSNKPSVFDYTKDIEEINKRLIPLIKDSSKCPAGDECPFIIPIKGQIDFLTEQITEKTLKGTQERQSLDKWKLINSQLGTVKDTTELYITLKTIKDKIKILFESKEIIIKYDLFSKTLVEIEERKKSLNEQIRITNEKINEINEDIKKLEKELDNFDINKVNIDLANIRISVSGSRKIQQEASTGMTLATNAQETLKIASTELVGLKKAILKGQEEHEALELLKEALSPRGIKAVVIDFIIPQLEDRINEILGQLSDFRIRLDTQQSKAEVDDGMKEGLFITIKNDQGQEMPYESYSGGEKIKITIAISEALASLLPTIGFRIMDENILSLDKESTESFISVLTKLQDKFPQLLIISHIQEVKDMFSKQIVIIKTNGISKII